MNIEQFIKQFPKFASVPSLEPMKYFMQQLGNPCSQSKIIHVAGTNGKGSFVEMLSNVLIHSGYKVGKLLSPHLVNFNERISVNNTPITDIELNSLVEKLSPIVTSYKDSVVAFDIITILALMYFEMSQCDFIILEVGLGGLYDSTNVVNPAVSVITSIGYDHINILGQTLEEIAIQKAGIIKKNSHTLFFDQPSVSDIIKDICRIKNNQLHLISLNDITNYSYTNDFQKFDYKDYKEIELNLKGEQQLYNASLCLECIELIKQMDYNVSTQAIREGLKTVIHKGRFEILSTDPLIIFDGAHNEPAIDKLRDNVDKYYKNKNKVFIVSILKSKDYKTIIKKIVENNNAIFFFTDGIDTSQYVSKEELYNIAKQYSNQSNLFMYSFYDAISEIKANYNSCVTFVVGSFYTYKDCITLI